jgi:MFS family permease
MQDTPLLRWRLGLLFSLYLAQGLPMGVVTQALPALLRSYHVALPLIGLSGFLALPWALKFLWAPWVDARFSVRVGQRRSWILPLQFAGIAMLVAIALSDPLALRTAAGLGRLFLMFFLLNCCAATQDIASDGLAVRILSFHERGPGNGMQVAGYRLGLVLGGGLLLYGAGTWDWRLSFLMLAALLLLATLPVLHYREPPPLPSPHEPVAWLQTFTGFVTRPGLRRWLPVLLTCRLGEALGSAMVKPMLVDMGYGLRDIGLMVSVPGSLAAFAGAVLGGWLTGRLGRYRALLAFGALQALAVAAFALLPWRHDHGLATSALLVYGINAFEHLAGGMATAAVLTAVMDLSRMQHAGADFTLQVSLLAISGGIAYLGAGLVAQAFGFTACFLLSGLLGLLMLWPVWRLVPGITLLAPDAAGG